MLQFLLRNEVWKLMIWNFFGFENYGYDITQSLMAAGKMFLTVYV